MKKRQISWKKKQSHQPVQLCGRDWLVALHAKQIHAKLSMFQKMLLSHWEAGNINGVAATLTVIELTMTAPTIQEM